MLGDLSQGNAAVFRDLEQAAALGTDNSDGQVDNTHEQAAEYAGFYGVDGHSVRILNTQTLDHPHHDTAKGQTGQQLLLGAYSALMCQVNAGTVELYTRYEMLDVVIVDGRARGIIARNLVTGKIERFAAHAVVIGTGGYGNTYFLSTNAMNSNGSAAWQCYKREAYFANPCFAHIHPTCIPVHGDQQCKLTLMSESLRNDGRVWVPKKDEDVQKLRKGEIKPSQIPEEDRDYYLERRYPAFGNLVPRDVASRAAYVECKKGKGVNETGLAVFLDFKDAIQRLGHKAVEERY